MRTMASLLQVSAALARRSATSSSTSASSSSHGASVIASALASSAPWNATLEKQQRRGISSTRVLDKRRGGASAFVTKATKFRGGSKGPFKKKDHLKTNVAPHKTHLDSIKNLKALGKDNDRNAAQWDALEADTELTQELDNVYEYLTNLGPEGDYVYQADATLADLDERDVLRKLNALARGDAAVLEEVAQALQEQAQEADEAEATAKHELSVDDYNFLMQVYAEKGLVDKANALLERMEKNLSTIGGAGAVGQPQQQQEPLAATSEDALVAVDDESLDAVPHNIPPNAKTYMYYIISLAQADAQAAASSASGSSASGATSPATAVRTLGRMKERGILPDVQTYNSVMNVCAKAGKLQWAYNIMEKMQLAGLTPDRASFTILMHAAIANHEIDKAFETFHLMRSRVTEPDVVAFTVLIHGYAKLGRIERAINLYEDLLDCGLTPSHMTFNSLILACAKSHHFAHKAVEFYHEMQELYDYYPDPFTYNNVLHACAKHGDYLQAERILGHMHKHQVPISERTYNTLFNVYARAQIKHVVSKAPRNKKPLPPPEQIYQAPLEFDENGREIDMTRPFKNVGLDNWNYDGTHEDGEDYLDDEGEEEEEEDEEDEEEAKPTDLMTADEQAQVDALRAQDKELLRRPMAQDHVLEDDVTLAPMDLSDFGKFQTQVIARAENLYQQMTQVENVPVSVVTLTSMLSVYGNALRLQRAEQFLEKEFAKHAISPNAHTYRTAMQMYVRAQRTEKAEALFEEMTAKCDQGELAKIDAITVGMLVDHYARHKKLRKALVLLEQADASHVQLEERHYKHVRLLTEKYGLFTELIPEDPDAVITAGTRSKLKEKRKVRAQVIAFNQKVGQKFLLPASVN